MGEAEKAEIANIVNKTRDELRSPRKPPILSRDKPSTLHEPGPDLVTCKEEFETGGGTIFFCHSRASTPRLWQRNTRMIQQKHLQIFFPLIRHTRTHALSLSLFLLLSTLIYMKTKRQSTCKTS